MKTIQITIPTPKSLFKSLGKATTTAKNATVNVATTAINRVKQYEMIRKVEVIKEVPVEVIKEVPVEVIKLVKVKEVKPTKAKAKPKTTTKAKPAPKAKAKPKAKTKPATKLMVQVPHLIVGKNNTMKNGVTLTVESLTPERIRTTIENVEGDHKIGGIYLIEKLIK